MKKVIAPAPHYPNWRYFCPEGKHFYDAPEKVEDFRRSCEDHGMMTDDSIFDNLFGGSVNHV